MRHCLITGIVAACACTAFAAPTPKEQLLTVPSGARQYVIASEAAKHGEIWSWNLPDGSIAYRMSMSLRGFITEEDAIVKLGSDGRPTSMQIRGFSESGDAAESFVIDEAGVAHWKALDEEGSAPGAGKLYGNKGGPWLLSEWRTNAIIAAGDKGVDILPSGHATAVFGPTTTIDGPAGPKTAQLVFIKGLGFSPGAIWIDDKKHFLGFAGTISMLPKGYEKAAPQLRAIQDKATAEMVRELAHKYLSAAARTPSLIDNVELFDSERGRFLQHRAVLVQNGKVAAVGLAGSIESPAGVTKIDGSGLTLVPGLWDSHQHANDDWRLMQNVATGILNIRSPGTELNQAVDFIKRRAAGDLIAPDGRYSVIVDRNGPLAAQIALTVNSAKEAIAAVDKIKSAGLWGVKFYTSMDPAWIAPAAAEAHRLRLHVHGHVPAGMRPLQAVRAGYDELAHITFVLMQAMPQEVVDKANTAARIEGPAKYGEDVDLDSAGMKAFVAELARRHTIVDPTLTILELMLTPDGRTVPPEYVPFMNVVPAAVSRYFKVDGYPLFGGLSRDDFRKSFNKMVQLVGRLHKAGVPIVAGTDNRGLELVRELQLYQQAGFTPAEAIQSATIVPARMTGMDKTTGSIAKGKDADMILVRGDPSKDLAALRHIVMIFYDGYRIDADALRKETGITGMPQ
jgi:hypothetical protein